MLVEASLKKCKIDYIDLYRPGWGSINGMHYAGEEAGAAFPQPMLVHVRGNGHFLKHLLLIGLICSPALLLFYFVFVDQTMSILEPKKGGGYNILLLGMVIICMPSMLVTSIAFLHAASERKWCIVSQGELKFLDISGLFGRNKIYAESFRWDDIVQMDFSRVTDYLCVWDLLRWNPVWSVPDWRIRIKVKEYHWSGYIKTSERENACHCSLSLGGISKRDVQELYLLFSAFIPANAELTMNCEADAAQQWQ